MEKFEGITKEQLLEECLKFPFPGNNKWESNNPIWDSFVPPNKSPREAWKDRECLKKAIDNLYWILDKSIKENKYEDFVEKHRKEFKNFKKGDKLRLMQLILFRFTVVKIAPKVTALKATDMLKIIDESGIDLSFGVYCPMAGFGGIVEASKRWFKERKLDQEDKIESYDINKSFVDYYHFTGQRDIFEKVIKTDKICIVCPPFGKQFEHWKGTPDKMSDITFLEWYNIIKKQIKAKDYIIIGPEIDKTGTGSNKGLDSQGKKINGLFSKTVGIQRWTDDLVKDAINNPEKYKKILKN